MKIPYGISDFGTIRNEGYFYADKTPFLPVLESAESGYRYLIFLRPRRFGKSTLVSLLEHYYDLRRRDQFDALFKGLWIHEHPTENRNRYLVITFDFSRISSTGDASAVSASFSEAVRSSIRTFCLRYGAMVPWLVRFYDALDTLPDATALLSNLLGIIAGTEHKLYVLIDEYDQFANRLLATGSQHLYTSAIQDAGFARGFFTTLKSGTGTGAVSRIFITGVSPLMLDDLSSGFNIAMLIAMSRRVNSLAGFTRGEVEQAVDALLATSPHLSSLPEVGDRERLLAVVETYYNGYRFSPDSTERVYNSDMVLYFLRELDELGRFPQQMLDPNVRTDYRHLQRIGMAAGGDAGARRTLLESILSDGHVHAEVVRQFGVESLPDRSAYLSLLYYLGMLTLRDDPRSGWGYALTIPNRVIRELQWEHLALMLRKQAHVDINFADLNHALQQMAVQGDIQPFLDLFHEQVLEKLAVRDTRGLDEKSIKLGLMTYLSLSRMFHVLSEKELAQGYCDLFLGPSINAPEARFSWLLELKHLSARATPAQIEKAFAEASAQVERYASDKDLLPLLLGRRELKAGSLVFLGHRKILFRPWPPPASEPRAEAKTPAPKRRVAKKKAAPRRAAAAAPRRRS